MRYVEFGERGEEREGKRKITDVIVVVVVNDVIVGIIGYSFRRSFINYVSIRSRTISGLIVGGI